MIEVYKYGGNILKDENKRKVIYEIFKEKRKMGIKVIMVVSAFGREKDSFSTDNLSKNIDLLSDKEKDQIITFGEIYSSLIIKNELLKEGFKAKSLSYDEIGIKCDNNYQNGNIEKVDMSYLKQIINDNEIVVVPGFIGESKEGKIISLGRNTSDLTAVIIAKYFNLEKVNIIKEVKGIFKADPNKIRLNKIIKQISYDEMISMSIAGSKMFSMKTLEYAKDNGIVIEVKGLSEKEGSVISMANSEEKIIFMDAEKEKVKIVFKNMEIFNELFDSLVKEKIKLDELVIANNVVYLKGNEEKVLEIISEYL